MADKKISALTGATTPLAGTEVLPIVQSGSTVKVAVSDLTAGRAVAMLGYTSSADSTITSANAAGGAGLLVKNTGDAPALTQYSYVNFSTGSDNGQSSVRSYRTNPGVDYQTRLAFFVNPSGATQVPIQAFNAESDGAGGTRFNVIGNIIQGTAAKGVNFTANTPAAGMTSQLLNWYEEGTFTPTIIGAATAGVGTYSAQTASYTRIGSLVTVQIYMAWSAHTGTGGMRIAGLPFISAATQYNSATFGLVDNITLPASTILQGFNAPNNSFIELFATTVGGGALQSVSVDTAGGIMCSLSYRT